MLKKVIGLCCVALLVVGVNACSGTAGAVPTVTQTVTASAPSAAPTTDTPVTGSEVTARADAEKNLQRAVDAVSKFSKKTTAQLIYGVGVALHCILTPSDWAAVEPYIAVMYQKANEGQLPDITTPRCDSVKDTIEEDAAKLYQKYQQRGSGG